MLIINITQQFARRCTFSRKLTHFSVDKQSIPFPRIFQQITEMPMNHPKSTKTNPQLHRRVNSQHVHARVEPYTSLSAIGITQPYIPYRQHFLRFSYTSPTLALPLLFSPLIDLRTSRRNASMRRAGDAWRKATTCTWDVYDGLAVGTFI